MATQTRSSYLQSISMGEWDYQFIFSRLQDPYPYGTVPEAFTGATTVTTGVSSATQTLGSTAGYSAGDTLYFKQAKVYRVIDHVSSGTVVVLTASVSTTTSEVVNYFAQIPSYIKIEHEVSKESFDLGRLHDGDKVENISVSMMDSNDGQWLQAHIFSSYADNIVYQYRFQSNKGTGALKTIFFGEIELRSLNFEPEYLDGSYRKQKVTFVALDAFNAILQKMAFGDNTETLIYNPNAEPTTQFQALNVNLPPGVIGPAKGLMNGFTSYKTITTLYPSNDDVFPDWTYSPLAGLDIFASYNDIISWVAKVIANRCGWSTAARDTSDAFSHLKMYYGGTSSSKGTLVADLGAQVALQKESQLSSNTYYTQWLPATYGGALTLEKILATMEDYSLSKEGTAWDGLLKFFECFFQYGLVSFDDSSDTVTLTVKSPLSGSLVPFISDEPKVAKLKYTPYGFAARSISSRIISPNSTGVNQVTLPGTPTPGIPTNNVSIAVPYGNANVDISTTQFLGSISAATLDNQLAVFFNGPDYTNVQCVDGNETGNIISGGAFVYPFTVNQGFGGSIGPRDALSLAQAMAYAIFSLFGGQTITDGVTTAYSKPMEIAEAEFLIDANADTVAGGFVDTTGIDQALLKTIPLTTDSQHTFIIIGVEAGWFGIQRTAKITAVRSLV